MILLDFMPWLSQLLLLAVLFVILLKKLINEHEPCRVMLATLVAIGFFVPFAGLTLGQWLRTLVGDLSVLTLVILADILVRRLRGKTLLAPATRNTLLLAAAVVGVVFYPMALGVGSFDPYRLGFAPMAMVAVLCLASIIAWLRRARGLAVILLLPLLAYNLHLLESDNLWNYLLDPVLVIYALVQGVVALVERAKDNRRSL